MFAPGFNLDYELQTKQKGPVGHTDYRRQSVEKVMQTGVGQEEHIVNTHVVNAVTVLKHN